MSTSSVVTPTRRTVTGVVGKIALVAAATAPLLAAHDGRAEPVPYGQGLLWKVQKGRTAPSHVFGTIHLSDERVNDIPKPVRGALERSRSLSVEMVIAPDDATRLLNLMTYRNGRTLERTIGKQLFNRTVKAISPLGLNARNIRKFKPWYVSALVGTHPDEAMRRSGGRMPLDASLARLAQMRGSRLYGLETFEEHFALFDGLSEKDQITMLKHAVAGSPRVRLYYERMVRSYLARDLAALASHVSDFNASLEPGLRRAIEEKLLFSRNRTMARRMQKRFREGRAFVAVGAAHLPGKKGVLQLLASRGFKVERVY